MRSGVKAGSLFWWSHGWRGNGPDRRWGLLSVWLSTRQLRLSSVTIQCGHLWVCREHSKQEDNPMIWCKSQILFVSHPSVSAQPIQPILRGWKVWASIHLLMRSVTVTIQCGRSQWLWRQESDNRVVISSRNGGHDLVREGPDSAASLSIYERLTGTDPGWRGAGFLWIGVWRDRSDHDRRGSVCEQRRRAGGEQYDGDLP